MGYRVVWFKRDLRLHDHAALAAAAAHGPVLCLLVLETGVWSEPDVSGRHFAFARECTQALDAEQTGRVRPASDHVGKGEQASLF